MNRQHFPDKTVIPSQASLPNQVDTNLQFHDVRFQNGPGASKPPERVDEGDTEPPRNQGASPSSSAGQLDLQRSFPLFKTTTISLRIRPMGIFICSFRSINSELAA